MNRCEQRWAGAAAIEIAPASRPAARRKPTPKPTPTPEPLPPAAELKRLLDAREAETRLQSLRRQLSEVEELQQRVGAYGLAASCSCPACGSQLTRRTHRLLRGDFASAAETLRMDIEYFDARLRQLSRGPDASTRDGFEMFDQDDDLPF